MALVVGLSANWLVITIQLPIRAVAIALGSALLARAFSAEAERIGRPEEGLLNHASPAAVWRSPEESLQRFDEWLARYAGAGADAKPGLLTEGMAAARERRNAIARL